MNLIPRKARIVPYGYRPSVTDPENYLEPVELEIKALEKAKEYIEQGYTYRATQDWLMSATGRKISNCGFYKLINEREDIRKPASASRKKDYRKAKRDQRLQNKGQEEPRLQSVKKDGAATVSGCESPEQGITENQTS